MTLAMNLTEANSKKQPNAISSRRLERAWREPRAVGSGEACNRRHQGESDQRDETDRKRRQQWLLWKPSKNISDRPDNRDRHTEPG